MEVVVTGHGHYATGFQSTIKLLAGEIPGVIFIDFTDEMSELDLAQQFPKNDSLVFFCDLLGGTPYKQAAIIASHSDNVAVISGCNIGSLLEVGLQNDLTQMNDAHELARLFINSSHTGIQEFKPQKYEEVIEEDGI